MLNHVYFKGECPRKPTHISELRLWPTGFILSQAQLQFLKQKSEIQFQIFSHADAQIVQDYLPIVCEAL